MCLRAGITEMVRPCMSVLLIRSTAACASWAWKYSTSHFASESWTRSTPPIRSNKSLNRWVSFSAESGKMLIPNKLPYLLRCNCNVQVSYFDSIKRLARTRPGHGLVKRGRRPGHRGHWWWRVVSRNVTVRKTVFVVFKSVLLDLFALVAVDFDHQFAPAEFLVVQKKNSSDCFWNLKNGLGNLIWPG